MMPRLRRIASASGVVGPFAPSTTIFALMRGAFSAVIWRSSAAGIRMSQSSSSASSPPGEVGGAGEVEDRCAAPCGAPSPPRCRAPWGSRSRPRLREADQERAALAGRTSRRDSRRCRAPGRRPACPRGPGRGPSAFMSSATAQTSRTPKNTPRPVASTRPAHAALRSPACRSRSRARRARPGWSWE